MRVENFLFFALNYLNDWCLDDRRFVAALSPENSTAIRLRTLQKAAGYYKVSRTLKTIEGEERLAGALQEIDAITGPLAEETVDDAVICLAKRLQSFYGRYAISAASKFLWLRWQWPVVILDDRAGNCLRSFGCRFRKWEYKPYRSAWREQFAIRERCIRAVCAELVAVKRFSLAHEMTDDAVERITSTTWFRERVFDKYLWWNSG